jgi:hypothetical protein
MNTALQEKLIALLRLDEKVRAELVATGELFDGYNARMAEVHKQNAAKLDGIVKEFGWPGTSLVGNDGADAAWLVLQHAIANPELQRKCLPLLKTAAQAGEIPAFQFACLEDRICVYEGRAQRYGTQFDWDESGVLSASPLQNPERVDDYRQSVGLGPLSEKTEEIRQRAAAEGDEPPRDFEKRKQEMDDWARSVGWR